MKTQGHTLGACSLAVALALLPRVAVAADPTPSAQRQTDDQRARDLYATGAQRYAERDFVGAQDAFEQAYRLSKRKELLYNIALCHREMGQLEQALDAFRQYLAFAGPSSPNAEPVRQQIADLQRIVPAHLEVHSRGRPATITLDGESRGRTPIEAVLKAGGHTLIAEGAGPSERLELMLTAGQRKLVEVGTKPRTSLWIGLGVGAGVIVVAGVVTAAVLATRPATLHTGTLDPGIIPLH